MSAAALPLWAEATVAALALLGAGIALVGSLGLLRLPTYFERVHAPAIIATLGLWCIMHASIVYFSVLGRSLALHPLLIALFIAITVPVTNIFLMRAALFRARRAGQAVPPNLSRKAAPEVRDS
ncbi:monovalent cation/H(+) antiporter subunit G [Comamonas granuli]|uniref:monovalent cation/H(+) antiporter subunit G n=1 Tax=Comamonas granuli TaxID=290309 RepID=UPI0005A98043|nr:monovalent cation/H(+) antiporter subunit G [Comamonas granuli]